MCLQYWDACILIYRIQPVEPWRSRIARALALRSDIRLVVSELSRLECRVKPLRDGDVTALAKFDRFFASPSIMFAPFSRPVFELATELRAQHHIKTPDALHLATAVMAGCSEFWTDDRRLQQAAAGRLQVVSVSELP
jgi:predicted nucleic acid-binding protein